MKKTYVSLDSRNRICLTKVSKTITADRFLAYEQDGKIILEPVVEIPVDEAWLFAPENKKILKQVLEGLEQKRKDKLVDRGSFAKYAKSK